MVCGTETITINDLATEDDGSTTNSLYIWWNEPALPYDVPRDDSLAGNIPDDEDLTHAELWHDLYRNQDGSVDYTDYDRYEYYFATDTPLCPTTIYELWEYNEVSDTYEDWTQLPYYDAADSTYYGLQLYDGSQGTYSAGTARENYKLKLRNFKRSEATGERNNWAGKYAIKAITDARNNELRPLEVFNWILVEVDVCGWEEIVEPLDRAAASFIPYEKVYYVEPYHNRSNGAYTYTDYTTTSSQWPSWHENYPDLQCDIVDIQLTNDQCYDETCYHSPTMNTDDDWYGSRLIQWTEDEPHSFLVDTADNTTRLGTESLYIRMQSRYGRW